jgi:hypothetical protein
MGPSLDSSLVAVTFTSSDDFLFRTRSARVRVGVLLDALT